MDDLKFPAPGQEAVDEAKEAERTEFCHNCRFSVLDGKTATCHRHPPQGYMLMVAPQPLRKTIHVGGRDITPHSQGAMMLQGHWPPVNPQGWCGEWEAEKTGV